MALKPRSFSAFRITNGTTDTPPEARDQGPTSARRLLGTAAALALCLDVNLPGSEQSLSTTRPLGYGWARASLGIDHDLSRVE